MFSKIDLNRFSSFPTLYLSAADMRRPHSLYFYFVQQDSKLLKNESFTLLVGVCLSRLGETTTSCPVCNDPTGVDCDIKENLMNTN